MQIIINSVYISSDDVNGWTQALARSFPRRSQLKLNKVCGGVFDGDAMMKSVLVCAQRMMNNV